MNNTTTPCLSFIGIVDFSEKAKWLFMTDSVTELLGFEPHELIGRPSLELVHPDEYPRVKQLHYDTIQQDKAAVLVYLRMKHKDPNKAYVLCGVVGVSGTVCHNVLVGSVAFASPGAKALHNASTAQEITVITPSAANFEFRRWHDPSPMPPSPIPDSLRRLSVTLPASPSPSSSSWDSRSPRSSQSPRRGSLSSNSNSSERSPGSSPERRGGSPSRDNFPRRCVTRETSINSNTTISFDHLSNKSFRTALILNRFTNGGTIMYCSNDLLISTTDAIGRSFYDFVAKKDEEIVRSWITCVKGWGVNEKGQPSDGGFGFGKFKLLMEGRDSVPRIPEPSPARKRNGSTSHKANGRRHHSRATPTMISARPRQTAHSPPRPSVNDTSEQIDVDAIFSAHSDGLMVILRRAS
ncbi:hypothetical protein M413DRAFT_445672 [Hebeloma cylindrosporum]|uniref:PAS domain-containing protein n=1 Tax=Hebeloma cylindrosporum TaxID=76867 RepID=A0A0C3CBB5_HEBCY|nr:hypothetical protein M413DRAFT_445672 [Hebeloma cylindrosporum h7]